MTKIFYKLDDFVSESLAEEYPEKDKWSKVPYELRGEEGTALVAGQETNPPTIGLDFKVKGWHKIFIGLGTLGGVSGVELSLTGEVGKTVICPTNIDVVEGVWRWAGYDYGEESFFKAADLTDKKLLLGKPASYGKKGSSAVIYVRLEEMSAEEVSAHKESGANKRIMWHFDQDYFWECRYTSPKEYLGRLKMLQYGNGEVLIQECLVESFPFGYNAEKVPWLSVEGRAERVSDYVKRQQEVKELILKTAHEMGMSIYGGFRLQQGDFSMPFHPSFANDGNQKKHSEFRCLTRDGKPIEVLSYAYPFVRKMAVKSIIDALPDDWDGVSLFFHRGLHIGIDMPVIDEVQKRFGVDARRLPRSDERLYSVICDYTAEFMRELKTALTEKAQRANHPRYKVNVVAFFDATSSKYFGCDVEKFLKENLIDSISQGLMTHFEAVDDCLADDGLIDLEKYKAKRAKKHTVRRYYGDDEEHIISGVKEFLEIQKRCGGDFYAALGWENRDYSYQLALAKKIYEAGAEKFIAWNGNHIAKYCSKLCGVKACGDKERILSGETDVFSKNFRLTSLNGSDISEFDPNWRG